MLSVIAPFGLAELFRGLVRLLSVEIQVPAFVVLLTAYVWVLTKIANLFLARLDFEVATAFRKLRFRPPALQFFIGDLLKSLPGWVIVLGMVLFALCCVQSYLIYAPNAPTLTDFWQQFMNNWIAFVGWLWR